MKEYKKRLDDIKHLLEGSKKMRSEASRIDSSTSNRLNMETKTTQFKRLFKEEKYKDALDIIRRFRKMLSKEESRILNIAWECMVGNESFYIQLGISAAKVKNEAYLIMLGYAYPELKVMI